MTEFQIGDKVEVDENQGGTTDIINDPQHYGGKDNIYEVIKVIEAWGLGFNLGNLVKYVARAGKKDPATRLQDLKKGRYYIDREIANIEKESE